MTIGQIDTPVNFVAPAQREHVLLLGPRDVFLEGVEDLVLSPEFIECVLDATFAGTLAPSAPCSKPSMTAWPAKWRT